MALLRFSLSTPTMQLSEASPKAISERTSYLCA